MHLRRRALVVSLLALAALGCSGGRPPRPALVVTGMAKLGGAEVRLDGQAIGTMTTLKSPPWLVRKIVGWVSGRPMEKYTTVAVYYDLAGTADGHHRVSVEHPDFETIELSFELPDDLSEEVVFLSCLQPRPKLAPPPS